jgi:hypothetical protein
MYKSKLSLGVLALGLIVAAEAAAYDPPQGAEDFLQFGNAIFSGESPAGGGIFNPGSWTNEQNPALAAGNQRVAADLGYTALIGKKFNGNLSLGTGLRLGVLVPSRYGVFSGSLSGIFGCPEKSGLGDNAVLRGSFAKDISETFYTGASLYTGVQTKHGHHAGDFALVLDLGAFFKLGNLGFLKDMRLGFGLANLGKTFKNDYGIESGKGWFPGYVTPKIGFAATLLKREKVTLGFSSGLSVPSFQNLMVNLGLDALIVKHVTISAGWEVNVRETKAQKTLRYPYLGIRLSFEADTGKSSFMAGQGWSRSDFTAGLLYHNLGKDMTALSAGAAANFGMEDTTPPEVKLWGEGK